MRVATYGMTERGDFEGKNILHRARETDVPAELQRFGADAVKSKLAKESSEAGGGVFGITGTRPGDSVRRVGYPKPASRALRIASVRSATWSLLNIFDA